VSITRPEKFSGEFKVKVALEAVRGIKTTNEVGHKFGVHLTQVGLWKKELQGQPANVFVAKQGPKPSDPSANPELLYSRIGQLKINLY